MKLEVSGKQSMVVTASLISVLLLVSSASFGQTVENKRQVSSVTLDIGHRMHPDFHQQVKTKLNVREQVGDSDLFFEVIEFYPHFAFRDSTKTVVSLSDEPKNPAFKIRVYENDKFVEDTWAFFSVKAPHFSPASYLMFDAVRFEYRGKTYGHEAAKKTDGE